MKDKEKVHSFSQLVISIKFTILILLHVLIFLYSGVGCYLLHVYIAHQAQKQRMNKIKLKMFLK